MIPKYKEKNTWNGWAITFDFDLEGCRFEMDFRKGPNGPLAFSYSSDKGTLTRVGRVVYMLPRILNYSPGLYFTDVRVIMPDGVIRNYAKTKMEIIDVITY